MQYFSTVWSVPFFLKEPYTETRYGGTYPTLKSIYCLAVKMNMKLHLHNFETEIMSEFVKKGLEFVAALQMKV